MIFTVKSEHYEEWDEKLIVTSAFVCADSVAEAVQSISDFYGEKCIEWVEARPFSPDNFLVFNPEDEELFHHVETHLGEDIVW